MRVLIAPDKFKGTLTARQAAAAMARGWRRARPGDALRLLPISDGGDGFGAVLARQGKARRMSTLAVDASGRPRRVSWWWDPRQRTAIIESARVIGLAMLPPGRFHPFDLDTRGLASILKAVARRQALRCVVGIGGSATNDGGFGLASGLGWRFLNRHEELLRKWTELHSLWRIEPPAEPIFRGRLTVAVDVQNPLLGPQGCTRVYGPQKGMRPQDFALAEACLRRLASVVRDQFGIACDACPGAGAAGGLGFGWMAFAGAALEPGFDQFAAAAHLDRHLRWADWVVTGEGRMDRSTLMGKGVGELALRCRRIHKPCVGLAGGVDDYAALRRRFSKLSALTDATPALGTATEAARRLEALSARTAALMARQFCRT